MSKSKVMVNSGKIMVKRFTTSPLAIKKRFWQHRLPMDWTSTPISMKAVPNQKAQSIKHPLSTLMPLAEMEYT